MRKVYKRLTVVAVCLLAAMGAVAQVTAYVLNASASKKVNNGKCAIYAFDTTTPWIASEVCYADTTETDFGLMGTLVGDTYYAYMQTTTESGSTYNTFNSLNMTTGNRVIISKGMDLSYATDMCYDEGTDAVYLLKKEFVAGADESEDGYYESQIFTVDLKSGRLTKYASLPAEVTDYKIAGITADGNGNIYMLGVAPYTPKQGENTMWKFWYKQLNLYSFNIATKEVTPVFVDESTAKIKMTSDFVNSSLGLHDGVLYLTIQANLVTLDLATKTATLVTSAGSGEAGVDDAKLFLGTAVGICFEKSTADAEISKIEIESGTDARVVRVVETYGDHMGERAGQMTHKTVSLYDGENRLQREATYGLSYTNVWEIEYFKTFAYNEDGRLVMEASQKYGIHDGTDLAFIDNRDTVTYAYDEAGNIVKKTMQLEGYNMLYEYDENGRLVKETKQVPDVWDQYEGDFYNMFEITYSAFNAYGQPDSIHSTGLYDNDKYFGVYTYDEQGRKIAAHTWTLKDTTDVKMETWKYDAEGDTAMVYWVHEWFFGFDNGEKRTVYTYDNGNTNRTKELVQTLTDGEWIDEVTYTITELSEMNPEAVATLELQEIADGINGVDLVITLPETAVTGTMALDVYRHGILLARLNATDAKDGKLTYADRDVKNGTYDYYVQTVLVDELLETEEALNVSDVVTFKHYVELPVVTDIKCTSVSQVAGVWYATIEWVAPTGTEGLGFQRYNVMLENMKAADNLETSGQSLTWKVDCGYTGKVNLYIQTVYTYGKANSEMISIDCQALGIENAVAGALVAVSGNVVNVAAEADVTVYNAQGAQVAVADGVTTFDLSALPAGIYLVKVETAEGVQTVKVRR